MDVCEDFLQYTCIPPPKGWIKIPGYSVCYFNALAFYNHLIICGVVKCLPNTPNEGKKRKNLALI